MCLRELLQISTTCVINNIFKLQEIYTWHMHLFQGSIANLEGKMQMLVFFGLLLVDTS